ncbi:MAG: putative signal transducing protein [Candidatus Limisoma sp.]
MENADDMVLLDRYPDAVSAYIVKGVLSTNGVESCVTNENWASLYPLPDLPCMQVGLMVRRSELDLAREILASAVPESPQED